MSSEEDNSTNGAIDASAAAALSDRLAESDRTIAHLREEVRKRDGLLQAEQLAKFESWGNEAIAWRRREDALAMVADYRTKLIAYGIDPDAPIQTGEEVPNGVPVGPGIDGVG